MADDTMEFAERPKPKAGYKSYKKKYRKMRIVFEQKMLDSEDIVKQEAKAQATVKRLATENEYAHVFQPSVLLPFEGDYNSVMANHPSPG